jgi:hypothetical protein
MLVSVFTALAGFLLTVAALVGAVGVIAKSEYAGRPLRWLWRRNVGDPATAWFKRSVSEVVGEHIEYLMHHRNNGSSLLDLKESLLEARSEMVGARKDINLLLEHDAERDRAGHRYGPEHLVDKVAEVEDGVELLLEHDAERDTPGCRYGD